MIRWVFFFEEGNVKTDVTIEDEDIRISDFVIANPKGVLQLPCEKSTIYINLDRVKCYARQIVDVEAEQKALAEAEAAAEQPAA